MVKEAREVLQQAIAQNKDNPDLQILLSVANFAGGDPDQAFTYLEMAAKNYQPKP